MPSSSAAAHRTPAIDVRALSKLHGQTPALLDVTFSALDRELVVVTGPEGAGKTTLLKLLAGHMTPSGGRITIHGIDARMSRLAASAQVGYVPQTLISCGDMRPGDLLTFSGQARQIAPERLDARLREVIAECELEPSLDSSCAQLDAPARARVAIAQVLLHDPSVLLLDDVVPVAGQRDAASLAQLVHGLRRRRTVVVTGPVSLVDAFPDARLITLDHGRLTFDSAVPVLGRRHRR
ncbi:MAG: ATP-binding cassette domain-containing protein [Vicinamibacterales bacterium]